MSEFYRDYDAMHEEAEDDVWNAIDQTQQLTPEEIAHMDKMIDHLLEEEQEALSISPPLEPHPKVKAFYDSLRPSEGWTFPQQSAGRTYEDMRETARLDNEILDSNFQGFQGFPGIEGILGFWQFFGFSGLLFFVTFFNILGLWHFLRYTHMDTPSQISMIFGLSIGITFGLGYLIVKGDN